MAVTTREITLDVSRSNVFQSVIAKQHDSKSRFLKVSIADLGVKIAVPTGAMVMLNATRPDKKKQSFLGEVNDDGTVTVPLASWLLELAGKAICDVSIVTEDGQRLTTMKFALEIEPASCSNSDVSGEEDYDLLVALLGEVTALSNEEKARMTNEEERMQAEALRAAAEAKRASNEQGRDFDENQRINAEVLRSEAESARIAAEEVRIDHENNREQDESDRYQAEQVRIRGENGRVKNENERDRNENHRMDAEALRTEAEGMRVKNETVRHFSMGEMEHYLGLSSPFTPIGGFTERVSVPAGAKSDAKIAKIGGYTHRYHYESDGHAYDEPNAVRISAIKDQNGEVLLSIPDVNGLVGLGNDAAYANYIFFDGGRAYFRQGCRLAPFAEGSAPQAEEGETVRESYTDSACVIELACPIVSDISDRFGEDPSGVLNLEGVTELSFELAGFTHKKDGEEVNDGVIGYYDADSPFDMGLFEILLESGSEGMRISQELNLKAQLKSYCEQIVEDQIRQTDIAIKRYGVRFGGSSNAGDTVERLHDAVGLVAGVGTDTTAPQNDFDNVFPWNARRRCCGVWDENGSFVVNAYQGEPGYTEDGTNGEVWVEHSLFYFKHEYSGAEETIVISATPLAGYAPAPIFQKNGNKDAPYQKAYTPAFPMATIDGQATSRAGVFSGFYSLNTAMTAARTLGERYTTTTAAEWYTDCLYMWVEFATRNLQGIMSGATNMPYAVGDTATVAETGANRIIVSNSVASDFTIGQTIGIGTSLGATNIANNRIVTAIETYDEANKAIEFDGDAANIAVGNIVFTLAWKNGACNSVIASSGSPISNTDGKHNCVYRGKETPYGNTFEWISDVLIKQEGEGTDESPYTYDPYFLPDPTKYANGTITADYVKLNFKLPASNGYVKTLGMDNRFPWARIPSETGASSNTYYSDYYYKSAYTVCAARVGGSWAHDSYSGPCSWFCYNAPSALHIYYRARLSYRRGD